MNDERAHDDLHHAGIRRALRRDAQRRKARQGMRVSARPDGLRPVTARRLAKLSKRR